MTETIATIWGLSMPHALSPEPQTLDLIKFHKPLRRVFVCPFSSWRKQGPRSFRVVVIQPGGGQCGASLLKPQGSVLGPLLTQVLTSMHGLKYHLYTDNFRI